MRKWLISQSWRSQIRRLLLSQYLKWHIVLMLRWQVCVVKERGERRPGERGEGGEEETEEWGERGVERNSEQIREKGDAKTQTNFHRFFLLSFRFSIYCHLVSFPPHTLPQSLHCQRDRWLACIDRKNLHCHSHLSWHCSMQTSDRCRLYSISYLYKITNPTR